MHLFSFFWFNKIKDVMAKEIVTCPNQDPGIHLFI